MICVSKPFRDLADAFTNCTLMSYLPGFSGKVTAVGLLNYMIFVVQ